MKPPRDPWAVVTGAAGGIGKAVTQALLEDGMRVLAIDLSTKALAEKNNPRLALANVDLCDEKAVRSAIDDVGQDGGIKALVCCAAVYTAMPIESLDEAVWDHLLNVNVIGSLIACQAGIPHMRGVPNASIVAFSSTIARTGGLNSCHYAASKGAILGLVRSLALDLVGDGIRVNSVSPGLTDTPQPRANLSETQLAERVARIPLRRMGLPTDSAEAVRFLLGAEASFITGQDLRVTGGASLI